MNIDEFKADIQRDEVKKVVDDDLNASKNLSISGTPTYFIIFEGKVEKVEGTQDLIDKVKAILGDPEVNVEAPAETK